MKVALLIGCALSLASCAEKGAPKEASGVTLKASAGGFADVLGVKLHYEITGDGPALLLLHGGLSSSVDFQKNVPEFSKSYKVIAVDRRGHGKSYDNSDPFSYAAMAEEMKAVLDFLGVDSAFVLGWSDGGVVGYHLASKYPAVVRKLIAIGANCQVDGMTQEAVEWTKTRLNQENLSEDYPEVVDNYKARNPRPENLGNFLAKTRALWLRDPYIESDDLMKIQAPVLFVIGDRDDIRIEHVLEMRALVKNSQLCIVPNATHFLLSEKPEIVNPIILEFLNEKR
jgi:pimeloyl-ACP methyl ester carboxylesterase